jgi:hypothetical protein
MLPPIKPTPATETPTAEHELEVYLQRAGDLDKARVLQKNIPAWLAAADLSVAQALNLAFTERHRAYVKAAEVLGQLKPLDTFCKQELTRLLKEQWKVDVDVERDILEINKTVFLSTGLTVIGTQFRTITSSRSLLHAAMENFTAGEAAPDGLPEASLIKIKATAQTDTDRTPVKFAALCRNLDLGARYQRHIDEVLALPAKPLVNAPVDVRASAADIRQLKLLDLEVAAHMAVLKKDISSAAYTMLLNVLKQDVPADRTRGAVFDGGPVIWQGLEIHEACVCGVLVFSKVSIDTAPSARCLVYMPNEPRRPLYEYATLDEFKDYLTLHLQSKSYRKTFTEQYLHGHEKTDFFSLFDKDRKLGTLAAMSADTCLGDFCFSAFVSKTQKDARILAVPTADVDEQQREKHLQALLDAGLVLLNAASFFVPVVGQLMLTVAVVDIVSEVYEGVQAWTHGERNEALSHLINVVESVAQLAAFAAGGKIVATAVSKAAKEQAAFFDGFEAVTNTEGKERLWKRDLEPYRQVLPLAADVHPDAQGIYHQGDVNSIVLDQGRYAVSRTAAGQPWQINHPLHPEAFQPAVERNAQGGWRHAYEHAHEWPDGSYALKRTDPQLIDLESDLPAIADITEMSPARIHHLHETNLKLPQRLDDCVERLRLDRKISAMIAAMERGESANIDYVQEQLHTLPRLPGWPGERFIEVRDGQAVVSRYPQSAPANDEINSVHVSQQQLGAGQLLETVIEGLYTKEVEAMIGTGTTGSQPPLLAKAIAAGLKKNRRPLFDWLYEKYDGTASADVVKLREQFPDLPTRVGEALLENASGRDRTFLKDRKVGLDLVQQAREAQSAIRQDRALTGLHVPALANADTDAIAFRWMDRLHGWDNDFRLEVRDGSQTGTLLDSVGETDASHSAVIVKVSDGYQFTEVNGTATTTTTSPHLVESIYHALPKKQRTALGLSGSDSLNVRTLRSRLLTLASGDQARTAQLLRNDRTQVAKHLGGCVQSDPPGASSYARGMLRKVKKLYPTFTDAQASAFLDEAGTSQLARANRLKELGEQLQTFLKVLKTWRTDEAQMAKLPGQINDIRVSRRVVANTLENCWRRVTPPRWPANGPDNQTLTLLKLDNNPVGQLPTLTEQDVAHVRSLAIRQMEAGDELAYFLKPFKGLTRLELDGNRLTRLPEAITQMSGLEHLSLNNNQLVLTEHTLRKLADMRELRVLGLSGNRLGATPDVSKMFNLHSLFLDNTHATELPVGLNRLPYLDMVGLRSNELRTLPDWLFAMPRRFAQAINLRHNPLSEASRAKLSTYRQATGQGMGFLVNDTAVINEQLARDLWMPKRVEQSFASRNRLWLALKNEPAANGFFELLSEVGSTADNRYVREDMTRRVWSVIEATATDSALREQLLSLAVKANCTDCAAATFSNLEVAVEIDKVVRQSVNAHDRAARLLQLGRRLFRQDYLGKIAREDFVADPMLDPVEVELAYRVDLAERLELIGQPKRMKYKMLAGMTPAKLETAYGRVAAAELSPELLKYLNGRTFWVDFLREHQGRQFTNTAEPFQTRMQAAFENQQTLGSEYQTQVDGIMAEMERAETSLLERLTQDALKAEELATCFALD